MYDMYRYVHREVGCTGVLTFAGENHTIVLHGIILNFLECAIKLLFIFITLFNYTLYTK